MTPIRMEKIESASRIAMAYIEAFNRHDISAIMQLISDDCHFETASPAPDGATMTGKPAITQYFQDLFTKFPQAHLKAEQLLGFGSWGILLVLPHLPLLGKWGRQGGGTSLLSCFFPVTPSANGVGQA
jgi:ketosteroid isomerase-like protein